MRLFQPLVWWPSGGGSKQGAAETIIAESLAGCHSTRRGGGKLRRGRARGVLNPCAQESKARTGNNLEVFFSDVQGFRWLDAGWRDSLPG